MATHLSLVPTHPHLSVESAEPAGPAPAAADRVLDVAEVARLLSQLAGPGPTSREHLAARAAAAPTGAVERLRLVR